MNIVNVVHGTDIWYIIPLQIDFLTLLFIRIALEVLLLSGLKNIEGDEILMFYG